jgi:hypothetical protein
MRIQRVLALVLTCAFLFGVAAYAQDSQSLGDVARQSRQQKQQKDAQVKTASPMDATGTEATTSDTKGAPSPKPPHVITNEEIGSDMSSTVAASDKPESDSKSGSKSDASSSSTDRNAQSEELKSHIQEQKSAIDALQSQITEVSESIRFAGANCVRNCEQWNEHQKQKKDQVDSMKAELEQQKKHLEEMQESARKQGFGSSVYEP